MNSDQEIIRDRRKPGVTRSNTLWPQRAAAESPFPPPSPIPEHNIAQLFLATAAERQHKFFARFKSSPKDEWNWITWQHAGKVVCEIAQKLEECGVKRGDRVAVMSSTRYEWLLADLAILALGAVSVPIFQTLTAQEAGYVLWDSDAKVVFAENQEQVDKLALIDNKPFVVPKIEGFEGGEVTIALDKVLTFEEAESFSLGSKVTGIKSFASLEVGNIGDPENLIPIWIKRTSAIRSNEIASIVYTSGTTDPPKGVVQTHGNHLAMLDMVVLSGLVSIGEGVFLYLPLAHSFARLIAYAILPSAGDLIFPTIIDKKASKFDAKQLIKDLRETGPRIFPSVPRIFEKLQDTLSGGGKPTRKSKLLAWARTIHSAELQSDRPNRNPILGLKRKLARQIVRSVKKKLFGENLLYCVSGGAPISVDTLKFFQSIDIIILEGYGLTETCPATNVNTIEKYKFGTVGRFFEGVECILNPDDGEICVRGGNIAQGYWKRPKSTRASWPGEGWFMTGDIGEIDEEGFLRITDRKKDIIVTSGGKKIPPTLIEGMLKNSPYISQALVYGEKRNYLVALITVNPQALIDWINSAGGGKEIGKISENEAVKQLIGKEIERLLGGLASYEQVKKFVVLEEDFTIENGLLGPSLKVKRKEVVGRYGGVIEGMYG